MNIRNQSDRFCKEHNLSVIDQETQKEINEIRRRKFVNWYDWNEDKKGSSYKSKLQFDIDRFIKQSINWQDFLSKMESCGYEIKIGKHVAFRSKSQQRFTRAKTIGANYTEERIKERILNKDKELGNTIDIKNNEEAKSIKGYEYWATKHNLQTVALTLVEMRERGLNSLAELQEEIRRISCWNIEKRKTFKELEFEQKRLKEVVKSIQVCINKREHYKSYKKNPNDKIYKMMNKKDIEAYEKGYEEVEVFIKQFPHLKGELVKGLKKGNGNDLFKGLNQHSKNILKEQTKLAKECNKLQVECEVLEKIERNMIAYLKKDNETKKSIIEQIGNAKHLQIENTKKKKQKEMEL